MSRIRVLILATCGAVCSVGYGQTALHKAPAGNTSATDDKRIEAAIRTRLATSKIGKDGFSIRVQGGAAYWDGTTSVLQHKGAATRMAKAAGAVRVVNNIKVSEAAKARAAENLEQGPRRVQIKRGDPRNQP